MAKAAVTGTLPEWHGWSVQGKALHVGYLPGRKSCCLYTITGSVMDVLAYFRTEEHAREALAWLDVLAEALKDGKAPD